MEAHNIKRNGVLDQSLKISESDNNKNKVVATQLYVNCYVLVDLIFSYGA